MEDVFDIVLQADPYYYGNWSLDYLENLDTSDYPFPNTLWLMKPKYEIVLKSCFMGLIGLVGLYLNSVILTIILKNKWLWTASNYLIANLAFVDFLTLLICPWPWLVRDFFQNYVLGHLGCKFEGFLQGTFLLASVGAVILVSYDRLAASFLTAEAKVTKSASFKLIVISWLGSICIALPFMFRREYFERQWLDFLESYCVEDVNFLTVYWHVVITILVWVPLGLMVATYGAIMYRLERSARKLKNKGGGKTMARARCKAMRISACVLLTAIVCRVPYTVMIYWRNNLQPAVNSVDGAYDTIWFSANFMIYVSCAINPLIYGFTNVRYRSAMDRTPGVSCWKFGFWCCVCKGCKKKSVLIEDKNTEKIFVIESSPKHSKRFGDMIKNILHINKVTLEFSTAKLEEATPKPTRITPLKTDDV